MRPRFADLPALGEDGTVGVLQRRVALVLIHRAAHRRFRRVEIAGRVVCERELREKLKAEGVPWYKRLFLRP